MMKITVDMVMDVRPCKKYSRERLEELAAGRESISATDVLSLPIPVYELAWLLSRLLAMHDLTREVARRIVRDVTSENAIPDAYLAWLDSGDEDLRHAARASAQYMATTNHCAGWDAARYATSDDSQSAAIAPAFHAAVHKASTHDPSHYDAAKADAQVQYLSWMAEWLDRHA